MIRDYSPAYWKTDLSQTLKIESPYSETSLHPPNFFSRVNSSFLKFRHQFRNTLYIVRCPLFSVESETSRRIRDDEQTNERSAPKGITNERNAPCRYSRPPRPIRCSNLAALIRVVCRIENRIPRTCFHVHVRSPE